MPRRWLTLTVVRALVLALAMPLAASSALPTFARAIAGPAAHVCSCRAGAHDPTCRVCNPSLRTDPGAGLEDLSSGQVRGHCGQDDVTYGGALPAALLPPTATLVVPLRERLAAPLARAEAPPARATAPPTPPPRA